MTQLTAPRRGASALVIRVRRRLAVRPESWLYGVAVAAGAAVVGHHTILDGTASKPMESGRIHSLPGGFVVTWTWWVAMVVATMLPVIATTAGRIAVGSIWTRRHRAMSEFVLGYLAVWAVGGSLVIWCVRLTGQPRPPAWAVVAALLLAAAWQASPPRRKVMRRCGIPRPGAARGWSAARDCTAAGARAGYRCVVTCGPVMVAMSLAADLLIMACLTAVLISERAKGPNPGTRSARAREALYILGIAGAAAGLALL